MAEVSGQAGAASGGESKGCDLQIYMNWNWLLFFKIFQLQYMCAGGAEPWQRIRMHCYNVSNYCHQLQLNSSNYCRENAMNFEGQNISLTDALLVDNITADLETFRSPNWKFCSDCALRL